MTGPAVYFLFGLSLLLAIVLPQATRRIALSPPMVLVGVGITFVAGPLYGYADRAAADMLSGLPYVQAVLPAGVR